jgi:predicted heme/steroid binding protein
MSPSANNKSGTAMRVFTLEELKKYDGSKGVSYVAYAGKVYDVSGSFQWKKGVHQIRHHAGRDLTRALKQAPHHPDLLFKFPMVGKLAQS